MRRKSGLLAKFDNERLEQWLGGLRGIRRERDTIEEILNPGRKQIARLTDDELAQLLARGTHTREGQLAASEMRRRESWRGPARWALIVSVLSLTLASVAFARTF